MSEGIKIPGLNIEEEIKPTFERIVSLREEITILSPLRPIKIHLKLKKIEDERLKCKEDYESAIDRCQGVIQDTVDGPAFATGFLQVWSSSRATSQILSLTQEWNSLGADIDRKKTLAIATISFYVAILSFVLPILFGVMI